MNNQNKLKIFLGYLNISLFFLVIFTYFVTIGVILREILFAKFSFYFNSSAIVLSNYHTLLLPYVFASILFFIFLIIYYYVSNSFNNRIFNKPVSDNIIFFIFLLIFWIILLGFLLYGPVFSEKFITGILIFGIILVFIILVLFSYIKTRYFLNVFICFMVMLMIYEVFTITFGKKFIMNEWVQLDETTLVENNWISNEKFLNNTDIDKNEILQLYKMYKQNHRIVLKDYDLNKLDIEIILQKLTLDEKFDRYLISEPQDKITKLRNIVDFVLKNRLEYIHRNMNRGQIDHISYIISPINEYINGKSLKEIYFQYGIGSTLIIKKIMELLGGISIGNYYKSYILYLLYFIIFVIVFHKLFGNEFYFKGSILILILSFYINSYVAVILAPGINPILHFMDIIVLFFIFKYYSEKNNIYILISFIVSFFAIYLNLNYGLMLHFALLLSLFFFFNENETIKNKKRYLLILITLFVLGLLFYIYLSKITKSENFFYMLFGFFNFGYSLTLFIVVLMYISLGYLSFMLFRNLRNEFKYLFIFYFFYSIEVITYYMQSGLNSHFNLPLVSIMISFLFALYVYEHYYFSFEFKDKYFDIFKRIFILCLFVSTLFFAIWFYLGNLGKVKFHRIFKYHKIYQWTISKSNFYSTIPQDYFKDSLELIKRYAKDEKGIYIISKFDILLTFLTNKYTKMNSFSLSSALITQQDSEKNTTILNNDKPLYIFVDNDLIRENFDDPYARIYDSDSNKYERYARVKKYMEMKKIFDSCSAKYKLVEQGKLISVFKLSF